MLVVGGQVAGGARPMSAAPKLEARARTLTGARAHHAPKPDAPAHDAATPSALAEAMKQDKKKPTIAASAPLAALVSVARNELRGGNSSSESNLLSLQSSCSDGWQDLKARTLKAQEP
ncbi:hypothetical protein ACJJTC_016622 [Scirpophaga incertulas]